MSIARCGDPRGTRGSRLPDGTMIARVSRMSQAGIAIVTSIALLFCEPVARGQARGPDVTLTLSSEKSTYSLTGDLSLTASLRNERSLDPVFVFSYIGWGTGAGVDLRIEDMQGKAARGNLTLDNMPLPFPEPIDATSFVRLCLGCFFRVSLQQPISNFFSAPGRYRLRAIYASVVYPNLVDEKLRHMNVLWHGHPPIVSPWITIDVKP